jgi:hypothetical protein
MSRNWWGAVALVGASVPLAGCSSSTSSGSATAAAASCDPAVYVKVADDAYARISVNLDAGNTLLA